MQEVVFRKEVSKGSRFNQIYIPKYMETTIGVGDLVQVTLLKKHAQLYYKNQENLSDFKEYLIKNIFSALQAFSEIKVTFVVGSFLHETVYNDIDIILIIDKKREDFDKNIENLLTKKFNQRFHILSFNEGELKNLIETDPLTRAMFDSCISSKKTELDYKKTIDENHIKFLLMMPEDLLEITLSSKIFYDNLRRVVTIEQFLKNKPLDMESILTEIKKLINIALLNKIRNNQEINKIEITELREILKEKIKKIKEIIKNE